MHQMVEVKIRNILQKQEFGQQLTSKEQALVDEWYANFLECEELTFDSDQEKARIKNEIRTSIFTHIDDYKDTSVVPLKRWMALSLFRNIAAAVLISVTLGSLLFYLRKEKKESGEMAFIEFTAPIGKNVSLVKLSDGSRVWLHPGSTLKYPRRFEDDLRSIELTDGMAYFSVTHDRDAPFIVHTRGGIETKVLGTTFNIKAYQELPQVEISLMSGSVLVSGPSGQLGILKPNQQFTYSKKTHQSRIRETDAPRSAGWTEGLIIFKEATFDEVAITLQDIYKVHFSYEKKQMGSYRFTMQCSNDLSLTEVADILKEIAGLQYEVKKDTILISPL